MDASRTFTVTFGHYTQETPWTDVRALTWLDLARGLTTHAIGLKEGTCVVPARFRGTTRIKKEADQIELVILDSDCGHTLPEIEAAIRARGWAGIIASSHSHQTNRTKASKSNWLKAQADCPIDAERQFLIAKGYLPHVADGARIAEDDGKHVWFEHQPCPKFRVVLPLSRPWLASDYPDQNTANAAWKARIEALAATLGLHHDQSCTDTSRLFYLPRRPADGPEPETLVIDGGDCDVWSLPTAEPACSDADASLFGAGTRARHEDAGHITFTDPSTGEVVDLTTWAAKYAGTFEIVTALKSRSAGAFTGHVADAVKHHIRCINEDAHTTPGADGATFIVNASEADNRGFAYHCRHAHCTGLDRLHALKLILERGGLTIADLTAPEFHGEDEEPDESEFNDCITGADNLTADSRPTEIDKVLRAAAKAKLSAIEQRRVFEVIKKRTGLPLDAINKGFNEQRREERGPAADIGLAVAEATLKQFFAGGAHLIRAIDKSFWGYAGTHWRRLTDEQVKNRLMIVVKKMVDPDERDFNSALNASFNLLVAERAVSTDVLRLTEEPPPVINCRNGELWIDADGLVSLRPHRYDSYLTYALDVAYDPAARCPTFDRTLLGIFAKATDPADMVRHAMEFMGYAIQPRRDIACYFMLKGQGNNGKSKFLETFEKLINARCIYSDRLSNIEGNKFATGSLAGKLILLDDDVDTGTKLPDGLLKKLSERKLLTGELKFKDSFEFIATCLSVLLANNFPLCADLSYGQRRRAKIIPFNRIFTPAEDDRGLFPRIWRNELPGILNRAIEGLQRLRQRGDFLEPADCIKAMGEWLAHANPLSAFLSERCADVANSRILVSDLYRAFTAWAEECGIKNVPARNTMKANLENLGYRVDRTERGSAVFGLSIIGIYYASEAAA